MAATPKIRHLRHRVLDGLERGAPGSPRLRKLDGWLERQGLELPAQGGLSGTATPATITFTNGSNRVHAVGHGLAQGEEINIKEGVGASVPTGLTAAVQSLGTFTVSGQPADGSYFEVGDSSYCFKTSTNHANANEVLIGSDLAETIANMGRAVDGGVSGDTVSRATKAHPDVKMLRIAGSVLTFEARIAGDIDIALDAESTDIADVDIAGGSGQGYFVISINADAFQLATTYERALEGHVKGFSDNGTPTITAERIVDVQEVLDLMRAGISSVEIEAVNDIDDL